MADGYKTFAHEWFEEVWNKGDASAMDRLLLPDFVSHGLKHPAGGPVSGPSGLKPFHTAFRKAFPDIRIQIAETVSEGDMLACRCVVTGTHLGEGLAIPPTGKRVEFTGMVFIRLRDGRGIEAWNNFDLVGLREQIFG